MTQFIADKVGNTEAQQKKAAAYLFAQDSTGLATDGVLVGLVVSQTTTASASVNVSAGAGVVQDSAGNGVSECVSDTQEVVDVLGAYPMGGTPRNDLVVFDSATVSGGAGGVRLIVGTPNAVPTDPAVPATAIALARIRNLASATTVPASQIDDLRTFTNLFGTPGAWQDYTPTLYHQTTTTPVAIGTDVSYGRWRRLDPSTVQVQGAVARQAGTTTTGGLSVALPVPGRIRNLNCGTLVVTGSTAPSTQSSVAVMTADKTKIVVTDFAGNYLNADPLAGVRFSVTYEG